MNYKLTLIALLLVVVMVGISHATTDTVGDTSGYTSLSSGVVIAVQLQASASGALQSVGINWQSLNGGGNVRTAIYSDSSGSPGTLLAQSASTPETVGQMDLPVTGVSITAGTYYWLAFQVDNGNPYIYYGSGNPTGGYHFSQSYGSFTSSPSWSPGDNGNYNLRMTYVPTGPITGVTISPTLSTIFLTQSQTYTASVIGDDAPFTYNWAVYNSVGALVYNVLDKGDGSYSNVITFTPTYLDTYYTNVIVTDNQPVTVNSVKSKLDVVPVNSIGCVNGIPTNIIGTIPFENYNTSRITVYSDTYYNLQGYYGSSISSLAQIVNTTATQPYIGPNFNLSTTLTFLPNQYGKYNYTVPTNFHCQWWPASSGGGSSGSGAVATPSVSVGIPEHILFILFFIATIAFIMLLLVLLPADLKKMSLRPLFLLLFIIAFWVGSVPALLAKENTVSVSFPTYNVITGTSTTQVPAYTVNAISTLSVSTYNSYFYVWLGLLTFLLFLLLFWFILLLRTRANQILKEGHDSIEGFERNH